MIHVTVPGNAVPMARPRVVNNGRHANTYNPIRMRVYERYARLQAMSQYHGKPIANVPISIKIIVYHGMRKTWSRNKQRKMQYRYVPVRPDLDNYCKDIIDAMIGVLYKDDNLMAHLDAYEMYAYKPRIEFYVKPIKEVEK